MRPCAGSRWVVLFFAALLFGGVVDRVLSPGVSWADDSPTKGPAVVQLVADPARLSLTGPRSSASVLIHGQSADGLARDLTDLAQGAIQPADLAEVRPGLRVVALRNGAGTLTVRTPHGSVTVPVTVTKTEVATAWHFENDVVPLLNKFGCNGSGCHGKAEGQNGFKLSVFGSDPPADYLALTREARGRRVVPAIPESSLLLTKASGGAPHGGGIRIPKDSDEYRVLYDWIASGLPVGDPEAPRVVRLNVFPNERQLTPRATQRLRVVATYSDGREVDVTPHAKYQSNHDGLASVDEGGRITIGDVPGEVAIMAAFMGEVDVFRALIPRPEKPPAGSSVPQHNFIDKLVDAKLGKLNIVPSGLCGDADFLRRAYLDIIGTLPTADEARAFLADTRADRRSRLVDALLERPEYADFWGQRWADVLRVNRQTLGHKRAYAFHRWIREACASNMPLDRFCREIVAAEGPLQENPTGALFKVVSKPGDMASTLSQVFLGIRIECAQCHHHPFDRWSQTDYLGMQAHFAGLQFKKLGDDEALVGGTGGTATHPRTGEKVFAHPLGEKLPTSDSDGDRRQALAAWMTAGENPWFARNIANRTWAHFAGRGLVEPVDDVRLTNPPSNPALLDALAAHLVRERFDIRQLIRTITASRVYQASSTPNGTNDKDDQNYSRALFKRLDAEVLFDAVCQTTGVPEKFPGVPAGSRAIQLWDSEVSHYFLKLFGRPSRVTACECERTTEPSVAQILHVMNSPDLQKKLSHEGGRIAQLVRDLTDNTALVDELYLTFYNRYPSATERTLALKHLASTPKRQQAAEDLAWSLMNTPEFLFNH